MTAPLLAVLLGGPADGRTVTLDDDDPPAAITVLVPDLTDGPADHIAVTYTGTATARVARVEAVATYRRSRRQPDDTRVVFYRQFYRQETP